MTCEIYIAEDNNLMNWEEKVNQAMLFSALMFEVQRSPPGSEEAF